MAQDNLVTPRLLVSIQNIAEENGIDAFVEDRSLILCPQGCKPKVLLEIHRASSAGYEIYKHRTDDLTDKYGFCPDFTDTSKKPYDRQKECLCRREESIALSSNGVL